MTRQEAGGVTDRLIDFSSLRQEIKASCKVTTAFVQTTPRFLLVTTRSCGKVMLLHPSVILFTGGGASVREIPPYGNERAVRILLQCILV